MGIINRLSEQLSNMIAAGEVVERPSAAVKELVENALDAQAKSIEIRFEEGGISAIEIIDDGMGMAPDDATLAFERHSTSKIHSKEDLFAPQNLGFRGEALPSIASVSELSMITSKDGIATQVKISYGKTVLVRPTDAPQGTRIRIEGLFRKTPARLKHLKSSAYEASLIVELAEKFALSRPDVRFLVKDEEKILLNTNGRGKLLDVYAAVYGNRLARAAHPFSLEDYDFKVEGLWIEPQENRSNQKGILVFVNGRIIRNWHLQKAVSEAYEPFLMSHRYPIALLDIKMDPKLIDVNVHPSKWEVRLSKEQQLYYLIVDGLGKALHSQIQAKPLSETQPETLQSQEVLFDVNHYPVETVLDLPLDLRESTPVYRHPTFPVLDLIGQMHGRYILGSTENDLYLIDQHAAKERVNYEKILKALKAKEEHFDLLIPAVIETSLSFMENFEPFQAKLNSLGIESEPFSLNAFIIRTVPLWLKDTDLIRFMDNLIERFANEHRLDQASLRDSVIATMACHRSVRFNQTLSSSDMRQILEELSRCEQPYQCPHGRPTLIKIKGESIWKDFER